MHYPRLKLTFLLAALAFGVAQSAAADEGCLDFKWDVSKERALFAGTPLSITAGKDLKSAPSISPNHLYQIKLSPQAEVSFPAVPGKKLAASGTFGGVASVKLPHDGSYRFSLDLPVWIDVVANGELVRAKDFEGQHACSAPHKIVEFELAAGAVLTLQLSNASSEQASLTVTASPARKL